jgi:hypothetical protein
MKISNGIKRDYCYKKAIRKIFRQMKEEIKDVVINRYINQIGNLSKIVENLKKENLLIKNDLIYILKRVLLNKNDYVNLPTNQSNNLFRNYKSKNILTSNGLSNTSILNTMNNISTHNSFLPLGDTINYEYNTYNTRYSVGKNTNDQRRYSIDDDVKKGNNGATPLESSRIMNLQNKIDFYLKSLYKHNFAEEGAAGTASVHLLNKEQNLYDELFCNRNSRTSCKNKVLKHINTDVNYIKISTNKLRTNSKKKNFNSNEDKSKISKIKESNSNNYLIQKNLTNGFLKVNKKEEIHHAKTKMIKSNKYKINTQPSKSSTNIFKPIANYRKQIGPRVNSRSKFLVNKI